MASFVTPLRNDMMNLITSRQDAGASNGHVRYYDGPVPANAGAALSGNTLLSEQDLSATSAAAAANGVLTYNTIAQQASADANGTPTFCRTVDSDNNVVAQYLCPSEINMPAITASQPAETTGITITEGNA